MDRAAHNIFVCFGVVEINFKVALDNLINVVPHVPTAEIFFTSIKNSYFCSRF